MDLRERESRLKRIDVLEERRRVLIRKLQKVKKTAAGKAEQTAIQAMEDELTEIEAELGRLYRGGG